MLLSWPCSVAASTSKRGRNQGGNGGASHLTAEDMNEVNIDQMHFYSFVKDMVLYECAEQGRLGRHEGKMITKRTIHIIEIPDELFYVTMCIEWHRMSAASVLCEVDGMPPLISNTVPYWHSRAVHFLRSRNSID